MSMVVNHLQGLKALVIDDYINICYTVKAILETKEITTTYVTSVQEALKVYQLLHPDILISDIEMPGGDGFSLIRKIRALSPEEGGQVPAIALTGYTLKDVELEAKKAGFQKVMAKPVSMYELLAVVIELLPPQTHKLQ